MDSNVSKNTNSHNFFKVPLKQEKVELSIKNLLIQELLLILDLYQSKFDVQIERKILTAMLQGKIALGNYQKLQHRSQEKCNLIIYSCPLGLFLASQLAQAPQVIGQQLRDLLATKQHDQWTESIFELLIEITATGWVNFYLDPKLLAQWLKVSLFWTQTIVIGDSPEMTKVGKIFNSQDDNLFAIQYLYARCCSLLRLGARENLIELFPTQKIIQPESILWLDQEDNLWFTQPAEYDLLRQLLTITDYWQENHDSSKWSKLAFDLSQSMTIFLANCRFLGEIKIKSPQHAIARLGLIALVRFWLDKILREKFNISAFQEM